MDSSDLECLRCEGATFRIGDDRRDCVFDFKNKVISQTIFAFFIPVRGSEIFLKCFFREERISCNSAFSTGFSNHPQGCFTRNGNGLTGS